MRALIAITGCLVASLPARADSGFASNADALRTASTVAIVKVAQASDGSLEGTVIEAFRGPKLGEHLKLQAMAGTSLEALVVCVPEAGCDADRDRGGFFVIGMPGRKGAIDLQPGLIERSALAALTSGKPVPALCVHTKLQFVDEPRADATLDARFSAADGTGTVTGAPLGKQPRKAALRFDDVRNVPALLRITIEPNVVHLRGPLLGRVADGCYDATVVVDDPIARTPRELTRLLTPDVKPVTIARGSVDITDPGDGLAKGQTAIALVADGSILRATGPLFADYPVCDELKSDVAGGLRVTCTARAGDAVIWLDVGAVARGVSTIASLAALFADGKPHTLRIGSKAGPSRGTATLRHVADR